MNAIGTQLRDPINLGLTRWRMAVSLDAAAELGRNPVSKHQIQPEYGDEQADAGRLNPSRETKFSGTHGDRGIFCPCSADHEQDCQPYPVDPYSSICDDHTYIHIVVVFTCGKVQGSGGLFLLL